MSSPAPPALRQLRHLDRSSSEFHAQVYNILLEEEYQKCVLNLQGNDLVWLIDFLDKVRGHVAFLRSRLKRF